MSYLRSFLVDASVLAALLSVEWKLWFKKLLFGGKLFQITFFDLHMQDPFPAVWAENVQHPIVDEHVEVGLARIIHKFS